MINFLLKSLLVILFSIFGFSGCAYLKKNPAEKERLEKDVIDEIEVGLDALQDRHEGHSKNDQKQP